MKILFLNEYAHPFVAGGAEESTMQLARALVEHGNTVTILTPNYGAAPVEMIDTVRIERYAFPKRGNKERKTIGGWWHTSLFWWCYSTLRTVMAVRRLAPDVIHIHGKFSIPAGVIAGRIFGVPTLYTARDYRAICNYGRCISEHATSRRCTWREYWFWEVPRYIREYTDGTWQTRLVNYMYALRGRVWSGFLYYAVKKVDHVISVSHAVGDILRTNGIKNITPIYNIQPPLSLGNATKSTVKKQAIFVGKLSPGKGAGLLPGVIKKTVEQDPELRWLIFTGGGVLEKKVREELEYVIAQGFVAIRPYVPHEFLLQHIAESAVVVIPSVWHEPLTRLALEALQSGTPVVITDRGGSREVVEDGVTGRLVPVDADAIADAIVDVVANNDAYRARIQERQENFTNTFCVQPIEQHRALYERMVAQRASKRTLGVILPPGGSLRILDEHGQKSRYMTYLKQYAKCFDRVFLFSYEPEVGTDLPEGVTLITPERAMSKRWYMFWLPIAKRQYIKQCSVLRVMQMDGCIPAVLAHWLYRVPFVATFGYKYAEFALLKNRQAFSKIMQWIEAVGVRTATTIIYTTEELRAYLLKRFGPWVGPKLLPIPNGVDTEQFAPAGERDPCTLLFVGRLEEQKNLFALLEAVAELPERDSLRLVWIGRGSLENALKQRARELGISLTIIARVDNADLPPYYQKAGVFTLVSLIEGMPKVLIEAMSVGCSCVVSDCDGNRVLIEDEMTGLVVGTDAASITQGLARVLHDEALRSRLGKAAREKIVAQYDLHRLLERETEHLLAMKDRGPTLLRRFFIKPFVFLMKYSKRGSGFSCRITKWTGRASEPTHPKHLFPVETPWYLAYITPGSTVLDVGCSAGDITRRVASVAGSVDGFDYDEEKILLARHITKQQGITNVRFTHASAVERWPYPDASFDHVLLCDVLEHVYEREVVMKECVRVLKPGGTVLLALPNSETRWKRTQRSVGLRSETDPDHKIEYTKEQILALCAEHQLSVAKIEGIGYDTWLAGIFDSIGALFPSVYRATARWIKRKLERYPEDTIGYRVVVVKERIGSATFVHHMEHSTKKALITGIGGQDGFYMAELLLEKGYEVHGIIRHATSTGVDRMEQLRAELPHGSSDLLHLHYADLSDTGSIGTLLEKIQPDELYNFAAHSQVRVSFDIPEYTCDITGLGAVRIFEAVRQSGFPTRVYQAGSSEMFGKARVTPQTEETPFYPRSPYAYAKALAHFAAVNYRESYGMFICNGILYNHESPRRGEMFVTRKITKTLARIAAGEDIVLSLGNLDAKRDWGYAPDYVDAVWRMLQQEAPGDYLLATGVARSIRDFVEAAGRVLHFDIRWEGQGVEEQGVDAGTGRVLVHIDPKFFRPVEPEKLTGDARKARAQLGWEPCTSFDDIVRIMVEADAAKLKRSL
ncbi:MAG: GDP-mannose 4,6-dehydratase [Candidatus Magasanikbacteria bacterium]|nr:GDP-mannose 4,6-dehydratase [Candidatus Magasanikbacteria bacterium]